MIGAGWGSVRRSLVAALSGLLAAVTACGSVDSGGGGACSANASRLRSCQLLTDGVSPCTNAPYAACIAKCWATASCSAIQMELCGTGTASPELTTCTGACEPLQWFSCTGGQRVPYELKCDGIPQCRDASDEAGCPAPRTFACGNGETVPVVYRCDGQGDCANGADESGCPMFACGNGQSVVASAKCDRNADCSNGADEAGCPPLAVLACPSGGTTGTGGSGGTGGFVGTGGLVGTGGFILGTGGAGGIVGTGGIVGSGGTTAQYPYPYTCLNAHPADPSVCSAPCTTNTTIQSLGTQYSYGACVPPSLVDPTTAGIFTQQTCLSGELCAPCLNPLSSPAGQPTGACG